MDDMRAAGCRFPDDRPVSPADAETPMPSTASSIPRIRRLREAAYGKGLFLMVSATPLTRGRPITRAMNFARLREASAEEAERDLRDRASAAVPGHPTGGWTHSLLREGAVGVDRVEDPVDRVMGVPSSLV